MLKQTKIQNCLEYLKFEILNPKQYQNSKSKYTAG
jgi:hypothetical protein